MDTKYNFGNISILYHEQLSINQIVTLICLSMSEWKWDFERKIIKLLSTSISKRYILGESGVNFNSFYFKSFCGNREIFSQGVHMLSKILLSWLKISLCIGIRCIVITELLHCVRYRLDVLYLSPFVTRACNILSN